MWSKPSEVPLLGASQVGNDRFLHGRPYLFSLGLYDHRARFYEPGTQLFLEPDPLGPVDSPNLYQAFGFDGLNVTDPWGTYHEDVHRYLSGYLALRAEFTEEEAQRIADATQAVDENDATEPIWNAREGNWEPVRQFHFPIHRGEREVRRNSPTARQRAISSENLQDLGTGLHVLQDSYSHEGAYVGNILDQANRYGGNQKIQVMKRIIKNVEEGIGHPDRPEIGSRIDTTVVDETSVEPEKAMEMARTSYEVLVEFRLRRQQISEDEARRLRAKWSRMELILRKFVDAETNDEKNEWVATYAFQIED